jgi:hypothetical protein
MPASEPGSESGSESEEILQIENPPEIMWGENRSLLLTLRHIQRILRSDPETAFDLLSVAYLDARQIIEDADAVVREVRGQRAPQRKLMAALAESIEGELEADDDADDEAGLDGDDLDDDAEDGEGEPEHGPSNGTAKLTE